MSLCLLDEENFHQCCQLLLQQSDELRDGWSWEPIQGTEEGYLRKTALRSVIIDASIKWDQEVSRSDSETHTSCDSGPDQQKQCALAAPSDADIIAGDIDENDEDDGVCAVSAEGRSLSLEEVWSSVHPNFRLQLQHSPLNTITQQEHPLLGQPFFMLHPCRTEEFMRPVLQAAQDQHRTVNYILTWLSVVGPLVGLDIPLQYSVQLHHAAPSQTDTPDALLHSLSS
ncbi:ubiquitin-like-conjugating enzyme ATG10 [Scomber scombrus]|uniref:Ubiquitin-like-conjugating enzyme ATG10 n=1 Tax=Scomber scombrus TaxID=13677 RepID=A0AAV1PRY9_SCOSC